MRNLLVLVVVALSAFTPLAARSVQQVEQPQTIVMTLAQGEQSPVAPDLSTIPVPREKPEVVAVDRHSIALGPAFDAMIGLLVTFSGGIAGWMAWWKQKLFKAEMDEKQRELLHEGIKNGILYAAEAIKKKVGSGMKIDVGSELVAEAGQYLVDNSAKVLAYWNLSPDAPRFKQLVQANAGKLGISLETGAFVGAAG